MKPDEVAERALASLRSDNPQKAREELETLIAENPERIDLRHSLAVVLLKMGEPRASHVVSQDAIRMCFEQQDDTAATMLTPLYLVDAESCEELYLPQNAPSGASLSEGIRITQALGKGLNPHPQQQDYDTHQQPSGGCQAYPPP